MPRRRKRVSVDVLDFEEMGDLAGKILDDQHTRNDVYALADLVQKYFGGSD